MSNNNKSYILDTTLKPNKIYAKLGIRIKVAEKLDTFGNNGNFEIRINNINLSDIEPQCNQQITKDSPIFCYVAESKSNHISKLQNHSMSLYINIDSQTQKDSNNHLIPISPKYIYLSFIPFFNNYQANNTNA